MTKSPSLIFFCHGAREPRWREPFDAIVQMYRDVHPDTNVELAFLEFMQPQIPEVIERFAESGVTRVHIVPLFLAAGGHTRRDLPKLIEDARLQWPDLTFSVGQTLTEALPIREAIVAWAAQGH